MTSIADTLQVTLGERSYPIHVAPNLAAEWIAHIRAFVDQGRNIAIISDENVVRAQTTLLQALSHRPKGAVHIHTLPPGEPTKSLAQLGHLYDWLAASNIDRSGALFALGGGVIGDLVGFAAASYLRGIDFYQVPTTLLAMVDSSVGGKTGINIAAGKNLVGAFYQPKAVYVDTGVLASLPEREFSAGMAEVIKYGMLYDEALYAHLRGSERMRYDHEALPGVIRRCCEIKAAIVRTDEKEIAASGGRALLNLGHTFAHGIENAAGYGEYLHGEAVSIGLVMAAKLSQRMGKLQQADVDSVAHLLDRYALPTALRAPLQIKDLWEAMMRDKKVRAGKLRFVAMERLGRAMTVDDVPEEWIRELWIEAGAVGN